MLPRAKHEDDDDIGLPALPPVGQDEELATELGLDPDFGDESSTSLDDSTAADLFDPASFLQIDDGPSVLDDGGTGIADGGSFALQTDDDEYGYTDGNEPMGDLEMGTDLVKAEHASSIDDGGAEGLDGLFPIRFDGDDSLPGLAPIELDPDDDGKEELMEDLDLAATLDFRFDGPTDAGTLPPMAPARVEWPLAEPTNCIALGPEGQVLAGGLSLFQRDGEGSWIRLRADGLDGAEVISVAYDDQRIIVGTRLQGVYISEDDGASFASRNAWCANREPGVPCHVVVDGTQRIWMNSGGALYRSDDGERWLGPLLPIPVVSVARDGKGVAALALGDESSTLFVSEDGVRWARRSLAIKASEGLLAMHEGRALVALPQEAAGPFSEAEGSMAGLAGSSRLVASENAIFGLRHVPADDRVVVVRLEDGVVHTLLDEASGQAAGPDGNHHIHDALMGTDGSLWLALGGGVAQVVPE